MTPTTPRSRIQRLEQSLSVHPSASSRRAAATWNDPAGAASTGGPGAPRATRARAASRAFDTGEPASLYLVRSGQSSLDGEAVEVPLAPASDVVRAPGSGVGPVPEPGPGSLAAPVPTADGAGAPAPAATPPAATSPMAAPPAGSDGLDGWRMAPSGQGAADGQAAPALPDPGGGEDAAFAQDIEAILAHAQSVGSGPYGQVPLPTGGAQAAPAPPVAAPAAGVGAGATHDVFEAMALANAPSRFAQGPVALSVDFDRLDRALGETRPAEDPPAASDAPPSAAAPAAPAPPPAAESPPVAPPADPPAAPAAGTATPAGAAADAADVAAITGRAGPFRVVTDAHLVPQVPGLSCHAAACATLVAWRDDVTPDAAAVAAGTGYWERYADGRTAVHPDVFESFGLATASAGRPPSPTALRDLLDTQGPLFVAASPPGEHAVVVAGITGDGTSSGTVVDVVDPWAEGMTTFAAPNPGSTYSLPVATFLERVGAGADRQIVVAHLRKGLS